MVRFFAIAASAGILGRARVAFGSDAPMRRSKIRARSAADCFAWQYAFYTRLLYQKAPGTAAQLFDITQVVHVLRGHLDPIRMANETLLTWPFDVTEVRGHP